MMTPHLRSLTRRGFFGTRAAVAAGAGALRRVPRVPTAVEDVIRRTRQRDIADLLHRCEARQREIEDLMRRCDVLLRARHGGAR